MTTPSPHPSVECPTPSRITLDNSSIVLLLFPIVPIVVGRPAIVWAVAPIVPPQNVAQDQPFHTTNIEMLYRR